MLRKKLVSLFIISSFFSVNFINHDATAIGFGDIPLVGGFLNRVTGGNNNQSTDSSKSNYVHPNCIMNNGQIGYGCDHKTGKGIGSKGVLVKDKSAETTPTNPTELPTIRMNDPRIDVLRAKREEIVRNAQAKYPGQDVSQIPEVQQQMISVNQELRTIGVIVDATPQELIQNIVSPKPEENVSGVDPELQRQSDEANEFSNKSKREAVENFMRDNPGENPEDDPELQQKIIEINREYNRRIGRSDDDSSAVPPDNTSAVRMSIAIEASEINGINPVTSEPLTQSELVVEAGDIAAQRIAKDEGEKFSTEWGQKNPGLLANKDGTGIEQSVQDARQKAITDKTNNQGSGIEASGLGLNSATQLKDKLTEQSVEDARQRRIDLGMEAETANPTVPATANLDTATQQNIEAARQRRIDLGMEAETDPNISVNKPVIPMTDKGSTLGVQLKDGQAQRETALSEAKGKINKATVPDSQAAKDAKTIADANALSNKTNVNRSVYLPNSSEEKELQAALDRTGKAYPTVRDDYANKSDAPAKVSKDDSRKTEFDDCPDEPATVSLNKKDKATEKSAKDARQRKIDLGIDGDGYQAEEGSGGGSLADKFTKAKDYTLGKAGTIKEATELPLSIAEGTKFPTSLPAGTFEEAQALADQLGANIPTTGNIVIPNPLTGALVSVPAQMATCLFSGGASCVGDAVKGMVADYASTIFGQVFGTGMLGQVANGAVTGGVSGALNGDIAGGIQSGAVGGLTGGLQDQVGAALGGLTANAEVLSVAQQASTAAFGCISQGQCDPKEAGLSLAKNAATNAAMGVASNAVNSGVNGLANTGR